MEKASPMEVDLEGWEVLPDYHHHTFIDLGLSSFIDMDYFSPSQPPRKLAQGHAEAKEESCAAAAAAADAMEVDQKFKDIEVVLPAVIVSAAGMKKAKVDSPKFSAREFSMPVMEPGPMSLFDEEDEDEEAKSLAVFDKGGVEEAEVEEKGKRNEFGHGGFWRWRLMGIGTLCSIGVAAASVCIFILGGQQRQRQVNGRNQRLQFQIYTDNQRIKQVVQQAARLNQAFTAVRGVPITRAHISFGGYYDGL